MSVGGAVIPAKAGIQQIESVADGNVLDPRIRPLVRNSPLETFCKRPPSYAGPVG